MSKLAAKRARELTTANVLGIRVRAEAIVQAFPRNVTAPAREHFIKAAIQAVETYLALLPTGIAPEDLPADDPRRAKIIRKHRAAVEQERTPAGDHRPADPHRHSLIGDLYEAYMSARGDDPALKGFKRVADPVLSAAGLPMLSRREQRYITEQIRAFADL